MKEEERRTLTFTSPYAKTAGVRKKDYDTYVIRGLECDVLSGPRRRKNADA